MPIDTKMDVTRTVTYRIGHQYASTPNRIDPTQPDARLYTVTTEHGTERGRIWVRIGDQPSELIEATEFRTRHPDYIRPE